MTQGQFNIDNLVAGCNQLGLELSSSQQSNLISHASLLVKWNKRLNLTAIKTNDDIISHHILDSLAVLSFVKGSTVLDIGSGAGFPGLPLAIADPGLEVTLLDGRGKRIEFLRNVVSKLKLSNVTLVNSRIEDYRPGTKFDTLTARAFSSLPELVRLTQSHLNQDCRLLALKGKHPKIEIDLVNQELYKTIVVNQLEIPFLNAERHLIIIDF